MSNEESSIKWKVESGRWKVENGKWKMEGGKWQVEATGCTLVHTFTSAFQSSILHKPSFSSVPEAFLNL